MSLAKCPFCGETVRLVFDRDFRRGVRCWSQRYGVANRLRALGEDDLADRLAYEE